MKFLIISDIHLFLNRRQKLFTTCNTDTSIDDVYNSNTIEYVYQVYNKCRLHYPSFEVVFLGDIFDNAYIKEHEITVFASLLSHISNNTKVYIIVGNHDSSSKLSNNKLKYSALKYIKPSTNIQIVTDILNIQEGTCSINLLSFCQRSEMYSKLLQIKEYENEETAHTVIMTHNNFYLTETFNETHMFPINNVKQIFRNKLTFINGHIHISHYENEAIHRNLNYYQLGSVSPTSFKTNPIASGIMFFDTNEAEKPVIFDNKKLVWLSIDNLDFIDTLKTVLDSSKEYEACIFLKYPVFMHDIMCDVIEKYDNIKAFQEV